eukprot:Skav220925  [mRNA]  locus=scaffold3184:7743:18035:+ [translate_table: standard]
MFVAAEWEEVSGFPQTYSRYYGPHAGAMSEDASKTLIVGRKEVYVVTDHDFENKVEIDFDELFTDMEGQLHVAAMSKDGSKIVIGGHQGGHVYLSSDGGETWTRDATLPARTYTGAAVSEDGSKIVVCNNPTYGSGDNGWPTTTSTTTTGALAAWPTCEGHGSTTTVTTMTSTMTSTYTDTTTMTSVTNSMTDTTTATKTMTDTTTATDTTVTDTTVTTVTTTAVPSDESTTTTTTGIVMITVTLTLTVDDPEAFMDNSTVTDAMVDGFATLMGVDPSRVTLSFQAAPLPLPLGWAVAVMGLVDDLRR